MENKILALRQGASGKRAATRLMSPLARRVGMSLRPLAPVLVLGILLVLPVAAAANLGASHVSVQRGACVTLGDPPGHNPDVALGGCGPKVILRLHTPAGQMEISVGPCHVECSVVIIIDVFLCSDWMDRSIEESEVLEGEIPLLVLTEGKLKDTVEDSARMVEIGGERTVDMETFLSCM